MRRANRKYSCPAAAVPSDPAGTAATIWKRRAPVDGTFIEKALIPPIAVLTGNGLGQLLAGPGGVSRTLADEGRQEPAFRTCHHVGSRPLGLWPTMRASSPVRFESGASSATEHTSVSAPEFVSQANVRAATPPSAWHASHLRKTPAAFAAGASARSAISSRHEVRMGVPSVAEPGSAASPH